MLQAEIWTYLSFDHLLLITGYALRTLNLVLLQHVTARLFFSQRTSYVEQRKCFVRIDPSFDGNSMHFSFFLFVSRANQRIRGRDNGQFGGGGVAVFGRCTR